MDPTKLTPEQQKLKDAVRAAFRRLEESERKLREFRKLRKALFPPKKDPSNAPTNPQDR